MSRTRRSGVLQKLRARVLEKMNVDGIYLTRDEALALDSALRTTDLNELPLNAYATIRRFERRVNEFR